MYYTNWLDAKLKIKKKTKINNLIVKYNYNNLKIKAYF